MKHLLILSVLLFSLWATPAHAVVLLSEGWEGSCNDIVSRWSLGNYYSSAGGGFPCGWGTFPSAEYQPFSLDTSVYLFGSQSLRYNYKGTQYDAWYLANGSADRYLSQRSTEIWTTWYSKMSAGFLTAGGAAYPPYTGLNGAATKGPYQYMYSERCIYNNQTYSPVDCSAPGAVKQENGWVFHYFGGDRELVLTAQGIYDAPLQYSTQNLYQNISKYKQPDLDWICYESHIRLNTPGQSNGLYELYITNVTKGTPSGLLAARHVNRRFLGDTPNDRMPSDAQWNKYRTYRQDGLGSMWYDGQTVSTTRVGCTGGSGGGGGDATPPTTPSISSIAKTSTTATVTFTGSIDGGGMLNYLILRCTGASCTSHTQVGTVNHTTGTSAGTYTFTNTGLTAGTVYSYRIRGQDLSGNPSSLSTAMEVTTDASSALPVMTSFNATSSGGTVTVSSSPATANVRFKFGGGTTSASFERTIAQLPGGVLTFQWPAGTTWACAEAGNAVPTYNTAPNAYICDSVTAQAAAGAGLLRQLSTNPRYFTTDGVKAIVLTGRSPGNHYLHDWLHYSLTNQIMGPAVFTDTFSGSGALSSTNWQLAAGGYSALTQTGGVAQPSDMVAFASNGAIYTGFLEQDHYACITLGTFNDAGSQKAAVFLNWSDTAITGYEIRAARNNGTFTTRVGRYIAGSFTELDTENATTWAGGDVLCAMKVGKSIRTFRNGTQITSLDQAIDATHKYGYAGFFLGGTNAASSTTVTQFTAGNVAGDVATELDGIVAAGQNYVRAWNNEQPVWCSGGAAACVAGENSRHPLGQMAYQLTGVRFDTSTGSTQQVGIYDLDTFNQSYFDRVRQFVIDANVKGITPAIMLFSGGHLDYASIVSGFSHPYYCATTARCNNLQSLHADTDGDGNVEETHTLANGAVNAYQTAYVCKMVQTLQDLNGFIFEISNEDQANTITWHNYIYDAIRACEAAGGYQQHLVAYSYMGFGSLPDNTHLFGSSRAEVVSPGNEGTDDYINNPTANYVASKICLLDSDHLAGAMPNLWAWKVFLRGCHPVSLGLNETAPNLAAQLAQMVQVRTYAEKINLADMYPENTGGTDLFSTSYGLSNSYTGSTQPKEFLMLIATDIAGTIDLSKYGVTGATTFDVEYFNVTTGATSSGGTTTGGAVRSFNPPGSDPMVVYLKAQGAPADTKAPILSGGFPTGVLAAGTTSTTMSVISDEVCEAKYDTTPGVAHASKASTFSTTDVLSHSTTVGSLTDGTSHLKYLTCKDPTGNVSLEYPISWSVAAVAADTSNTGTITSLGGSSTASDTAILWELTEGTPDANHSHYILEIAVGGQGDLFTPPAILTIVLDDSLTYTQQGLAAGNSYIARARAVDTSGNVSGWLTSSAVNVALPETMAGLTTAALYTSSAIVTVNEAAQNGVNGSYELCTGAACDSGWTTAGIPAGLSVTFSSLTPNTTYGVRGKWVNLSLGGISAEWSDTLYFTTPASGGTSGPRTSPSFGIERTPLANTRTPLARSRIAR